MWLESRCSLSCGDNSYSAGKPFEVSGDNGISQGGNCDVGDDKGNGRGSNDTDGDVLMGGGDSVAAVYMFVVVMARAATMVSVIMMLSEDALFFWIKMRVRRLLLAGRELMAVRLTVTRASIILI